ncbi:MAG: hypothetical protein Q3986_03445 [Akkermansia sp.]|nr:hypothetical protein [Akkermansia sp.]
MSVFIKSEAAARILKAADAVQPNALGKVDVMEQIAAMQAESVAIMRASIQDEQEHQQNGTAWMRTGQLAKHFGVTKRQMQDWLAPLIAAGRVRVIVPKGLGGQNGNPRYSVADTERAWLVTPHGKGERHAC